MIRDVITLRYWVSMAILLPPYILLLLTLKFGGKRLFYAAISSAILWILLSNLYYFQSNIHIDYYIKDLMIIMDLLFPPFLITLIVMKVKTVKKSAFIPIFILYIIFTIILYSWHIYFNAKVVPRMIKRQAYEERMKGGR